MKLNKKGSALIESIVSIALLAIMVTMIVNVRAYVTNHRASMVKQTTFYTQVDKEIATIYSLPTWDNLGTTKTIDTPTGELKVDITKNDNSEFDTKSIKVSFQMQDLEKELSLERSIYYE